MKLTILDEAGAEICSATVCRLWADVFGLMQVAASHQATVSTWINLLTQASAATANQGGRMLQFRLIESISTAAAMQALRRLGFQKAYDRIEFQRLVSELPSSDGSPFVWRTARELAWEERKIAHLLKDVAQGDPASDPEEDPLDAIQDWLRDPVLTSGLDCIGVGFIEGAPGALVVAQINAKSGWSRISYMGLLPDLRGKGLGKWIHRQGFEMMRAQGGHLYHGGTSSLNAAMIRLFETHGCSVHLRMEEWRLKIDAREGGHLETTSNSGALSK